MIDLPITGKYANAILEIDLQDGNYEVLGQDLNKRTDLLKESKELRVVRWSPSFPKPTRKAIGRKIILSLEKDPSLSGEFLTKHGSLKAQMAKLQDKLYTKGAMTIQMLADQIREMIRSRTRGYEPTLLSVCRPFQPLHIRK